MVKHPGSILKEQLVSLGLSQRQLAFRVSRPYQAINEIIRGRKSITADTALQLEGALGIERLCWSTQNSAGYRLLFFDGVIYLPPFVCDIAI